MTKNTVSYSNNAELLLDDLKSYRKNGFRTVLLCDNQKMAENTSELLSENQIPSVILQKENTGDSQKGTYRNYIRYENSGIRADRK